MADPNPEYVWPTCVHCGEPVAGADDDWMHVRIAPDGEVYTGKARCQSEDVPYGHLAHPPTVPCSSGGPASTCEQGNQCIGGYGPGCCHWRGDTEPCCGPGEGCSSPTCTGTPKRVSCACGLTYLAADYTESDSTGSQNAHGRYVCGVRYSPGTPRVD